MTLYINACVRENSRTNRLAKALLDQIGDYEELKLEAMNLMPLDNKRLQKRTALIEAGDFSDEMFTLSKQFAAADEIVIAAPYWDGSFPAILKTYIENIYVTGIVSRYGSDGRPEGLCRAKKLYYVTTAGGPYVPDYSYDHLKALAVGALGIKETELIFAQMLDIEGFDSESILSEAISRIKR